MLLKLVQLLPGILGSVLELLDLLVLLRNLHHQGATLLLLDLEITLRHGHRSLQLPIPLINQLLVGVHLLRRLTRELVAGNLLQIDLHPQFGTL